MPRVDQTAWGLGVLNSLPPDKLPDGALAFGGNTAFLPTPGGTTAIGPRPGLRLAGAVPASGDRALAWIGAWTHLEAGGRTNYLLALTSDGKLWTLAAGGATELTHSLTWAAAAHWMHTVANNRVYVVGGQGTGTQRFKLARRTGVATVYVSTLGLERPAAPTRVTINGGGLMTGDYEVALTWYDQDAGVESSRGEALSEAGLEDNSLTIARPTANVPATATHWRVHLRVYPGTAFYQLAELPIATTQTTINTLDTVDLLIASPDVAENDPPPANVRTLCWHLNRMFYTDGVSLWFSKLGSPEQVDPENELQVGENDNAGQLMALWSLSDSSLLILKERAAYLLVGNSPQNWEIRLLTQSVGSVGRFVAEGDGWVAWWSAQGPVAWPKSGEPKPIAEATILPLVQQGVLNAATFDGPYYVVHDPLGRRFLFSLPTTGSAAHWTVAPWSTLHTCWEATGWDYPPLKSLAVGRSLTTPAEFRVFLGTQTTVAWEVAREVKTDGAANESGARLVHAIQPGATTTSLTVVEASDLGALPVNPYRTRVCVIDAETLQVHRSAYTLQRTGGTHVVTLATALPATPAAGSLVLFDLPVTELETRTWGSQQLTHRLEQCGLDLESLGDVAVFWGLCRNASRTPVRAWHETQEQTTDWAFDTFTPTEVTPTVTNLEHRIAAIARRWWLRVVGYDPRAPWWLTGLWVSGQVRRS